MTFLQRTVTQVPSERAQIFEHASITYLIGPMCKQMDDKTKVLWADPRFFGFDHIPLMAGSSKHREFVRNPFLSMNH